ncbi:hypothetical protein Hanom_Chr09g00786431 [Helianthus anomalus]
MSSSTFVPHIQNPPSMVVVGVCGRWSLGVDGWWCGRCGWLVGLVITSDVWCVEVVGMVGIVVAGGWVVQVVR